MADTKVLVFNENEEERERLRGILDSDEFVVYATSRLLEIPRILKNGGFSMVVASSVLSESEAEEFRHFVKSIQPDMNVLFLNPLSNGSESVSLRSNDFRHFIQSSIMTESSLSSSLSEFKEFFLAFTERLLQIFGSGGRYMFNSDHLVAKLSRRTALRMGLDEEIADTIQIAALLKDLGMLGIQQQFLDEKKRLSTNELVPVRKHPINTVQILKQLRFPWNVDAIILQHHENYDGSGYPNKLKGRQICVGARIVHVADSFVAMTRERPYRHSMTREEAMQEIMRHTGTQFDPEAVEAFNSIVREEVLPSGHKRWVLVIERTSNITPVIKLGVDPATHRIISSNNSHDAKRHVRKKVPDVVVVDVEMLLMDTYHNILNYFFEIPGMDSCSFIFVLPHKDYPRPFKGDRIRYLVKPLDMEELSYTMSALLGSEIEGEGEAEESRGLWGSLDDFTLADIIQILHLGLKTARVEIRRNSSKGILFLSIGNLVHARADGLTGRKAFFEMMKWEDGEFHIQHGIQTKDKNIKAETIHLLLEAARMQDEQKKRAEAASG